MIPWLMDTTREWQAQLGATWALQIFDQWSFRALAAALLAFFVVVLAGGPTIRWLRRKKIGDTGLTDAAALQAASGAKKNTPTMGGVLIVGAIVVSTVLLADLRNFYILLGLIVAVWLAVLGGFDDWLKLTAASRKTGSRQGLYSWEKLVFQIGLSVLIGYFAFNHGAVETPAGPGGGGAVPPDESALFVAPAGQPSEGPMDGDTSPARTGDGRSTAHVLNLPLQKTYMPGEGQLAEGLIFLGRAAFILMSILMIAGMSNASNISDGMDGLCAGVSAAVGLGVLVLCAIAGWQAAAQNLLVPYVAQSGELAIMAGALVGACLGFLWFNCWPASVFMGDTGSLALGGLIGYMALVTRQEVLVLVMGAVFIWEITSVVLQVACFKLTGGKRIFKCAPYHHHLQMNAWTEQQIVARFWIVTVLLVVLALASIKVR
jgi:phospho-N-acetylmuramoyl-pentapeptide-transferase